MLNREYTLEEALNYRLEEDYDLIDEGRKRNKVVIMLKHHGPLDRILLYSGAGEAAVLSIAEEHGIPIIP